MINEIKIGDKTYRGISYGEYNDRTAIKLISTVESNLSEEEKERINYTRLNQQRTLRIEKNYIVSEKIKKIMESISEPQFWLVITEDWCGDSAQNLPYIYAISQCNPLINLRIVLRDSNPELMDLYLTSGTRSIPKLIVFDSENNEIFRWGPRPKSARDYFNKLRAEGIQKDELYEKLHQWYGKDKGEELESEFAILMKRI